MTRTSDLTYLRLQPLDPGLVNPPDEFARMRSRLLRSDPFIAVDRLFCSARQAHAPAVLVHLVLIFISAAAAAAAQVHSSTLKYRVPHTSSIILRRLIALAYSCDASLLAAIPVT